MEIRPWSNFFPTFLCGLLVSCPHTTCPHRTFSHGTCPHTTYPHTTCLQTIQLTYNLLTHNSTHTTLLPLLLIHITCHHTTCSHTTLLTDLVDLSSHNCSTYKPCRLVITQLAHRQQLQNLLTQQLSHTSIFTLYDRHSTYGIGLAPVARLGRSGWGDCRDCWRGRCGTLIHQSCFFPPCFFRGRRGTWWYRSSVYMAGVIDMALGWLRWRALAGVVAAAVGVAGVVLWYFETLTLLFPVVGMILGDNDF